MGRPIPGRVVSGKGEAGKIVSLGWVRRQMREKLGFLPYPGTLNLELSGESLASLKRSLSSAKAVVISKPGNPSVRGVCYKVAVMRVLEGALVFPCVGRSDEIVEVVAPCSLRRKLGLKDGDEVILEVR